MNEETREEIKALIVKFEQMHQQKEQQKQDKELIKNLVYSINNFIYILFVLYVNKIFTINEHINQSICFFDYFSHF